MSWPLFDFSDCVPYQQIWDYQGGEQPIYIGWATPGVPTNAAKWKIRKFTYVSDANNVSLQTQVQFANGDVGFNAIWDNRAGYTYK